MRKARNGDTVKVHCTKRLENGRVIDTTKGGTPVEVKIGGGGFILRFEKSIIGMGIGETKTITLAPEETYGRKREELIVDINRSDFPDNIMPIIGKELQVQPEDGSLIDLVITHVDEDTVTLDANHPLAGETLVFAVELVEVT